MPHDLQHSIVVSCYNHFDLTELVDQFQVANPPAEIRTETLKLESELTLCHVLPDHHPLVKAVRDTQAAYIEWLPNGNRDDLHRDREAEVTEAKAIWSGISF